MERRPQQTQLPKGVKIYLPDEAAQKRVVEERLLGVFRRWGYREVVTPTYEYFDVLSQGTDHDLQEGMFKMVDRESGRLLALRADITPQIARIVATRMRDEPKPLRLAYVTNVFRYDEPQVGRYREFYQAGVELVGLPNPEGDAEMIAMTVECLRALGLDQFQLDVGQTDFFRGILEDLAVDETTARRLRSALSRKDVSALERRVEELGAPAAVTELLLALPSLYGLADAVLLDLGEVRGFDYYSGVHFEAYVTGLGAALAGGGRYDQMLGRFGYDCPATGFAVEVGRALLAMDSQGAAAALPGPDFFIIDFTADKTRALALARRYRDLGAAVARDIISRGIEDSIAHARQQRARWVLVIGGGGTEPDEVRVVDLSVDEERTRAVADLLADPARHFPVFRPESGSRGHA